MGDMELLTWICIVAIVIAGVMNLRHTESTLVIRQDFRQTLEKEQADRYQTMIGVVYIAAGVLACAVNLFADGKVYLFGMLGAVAVLVLGSVVCNHKYLPKKNSR